LTIAYGPQYDTRSDASLVRDIGWIAGKSSAIKGSKRWDLFSLRELDFELSWELLIGKVCNEVVKFDRKIAIQAVRKVEVLSSCNKDLGFRHQNRRWG